MFCSDYVERAEQHRRRRGESSVRGKETKGGVSRRVFQHHRLCGQRHTGGEVMQLQDAADVTDLTVCLCREAVQQQHNSPITDCFFLFLFILFFSLLFFYFLLFPFPFLPFFPPVDDSKPRSLFIYLLIFIYLNTYTYRSLINKNSC